MEATLTFELPDEREEYMNAISGFLYKQVISELLEHIRQRLKYQDNNANDVKNLEEFRETIVDLLEVKGLQM